MSELTLSGWDALFTTILVALLGITTLVSRFQMPPLAEEDGPPIVYI